MSVREDDPGRIKLRRKEVSGIFYGHASEGGDSLSELRAELRPRILEVNECDDESNADDYSDDEADEEGHVMMREKEKREKKRGC